MARPSILPLPDKQASVIHRGLQTLPTVDADQSGNRPFLAAFIRLVYRATDRVFGVQVYRQLLVQFGVPRAPSSTTIHSEIEAFRQELKAEVSRSSGIKTAEDVLLPAETSARLPRHTSVKATRSQGEALETASELVQLQQQEVAWLRRRADDMEARAIASERARQAAELESAAARAELVGRDEAYRNLQLTMHELTDTIKVTQERAAADNRSNMLRVDEVRGETREVDARLKAAELTVAARDQALRNAHALADSLRRQLTELRRQYETANE